MNILCTTSQLNVDALNLVQALAKGKDNQPKKDSPQTTSEEFVTGIPAHEEPSSVSTKQPSPTTVKGTRFILPTKNDLGESKSPAPSPSKVNNVATLNVLGMQPDFNEAENESLFTIDQTVVSSETKEGMNISKLKGTKAESADDIKLMQGRVPDLVHGTLPKYLLESDYKTTLNSATMSSVATQSLIANESIPDALPSADASNVTVNLDLGSITTLDPVESLGKSIGLLTSSNSKNLDFSVSNLVSPGLVPSGELNSKDDLVTSQPSPEYPVASEEQAVQQTDLPTSMNKKHATEKKIVEVNWESIDRVRLFDDQYSTQNPTERTTEDDHTVPVEPQHVKEVVATSSEQEARPDTRLTHLTHSTAPLTGGANMLGSQVYPSTVIRHSTFSSEASAKNQTQNVTTDFESWPSEVALTYTFCMASIGIFGSTSLIQRAALEGTTKSRGKNYGLLDLAEYKATQGSDGENIRTSLRPMSSA